jgi:outer membrane protein
MIFKKTAFVVPLLAMTTWLAGCAMEEPKPFDPISMMRPYRDRAGENVTTPLGDLDKTLNREFLNAREGPAADNKTAPLPNYAQSIGPVVRMSLRDLIQLAAANSLQLRIANYQAGIDQSRVIEAEARFDPTFFSNFNYSTQYALTPTPSNTTATEGARQFFETTTLEAGFKQNLPNGAQVQLKASSTRTFFRRSDGQDDLTPGSRLPFFENDLSLQITQPLLQNFGTEVNAARIVVARNTQRVSLLDARLQVEKTLAEIEDAYWQLVQAEAELRYQEDLYNQSVETAVILQHRINNDVTRSTIGQTNASLRAREAALIEARIRLKTLSNAIKRRVNDPSLNSASAPIILPEDRPVEAPIKFDLAEQIEAGFANRAELAQQRIRIDSATVVYKAAQNNLLPSLNLVGSIGSKGSDSIFGSALHEEFDGTFREYAIGFQLEIPLGNREAKAILHRTMLSRQQSVDQYQDLLEQVSQEVKDAHDSVYSGWERMRKARQSLYAAEEWLAAIQQEQDVGHVPLTPDFINRKLSAQENLAQARRENMRAVTDYNVGISALERAKGTLLKYDNVIMKEEPLIVSNFHKPAAVPPKR